MEIWKYGNMAMTIVFFNIYFLLVFNFLIYEKV